MAKKTRLQRAHKRAEKLWKEIVKKRAAYSCEYCKKQFKKLDCHHFIGRGNQNLRYSISNGVCLCSRHHTLGSESFHNNPCLAYEWFKENREQDFEFVQNERNTVKKWTADDLEEYCEYLKKYLEEMPEKLF